MTYVAAMGLGSRKERARLDRCCFLAARLWGWGVVQGGWEVAPKANWGRRVRGVEGGGEISK